jgi:alpha-beta hydrolase superfamily lysophospholipase
MGDGSEKKNSSNNGILRNFATAAAFRGVTLKWKRYVVFAAAAAFFFYAAFSGAMSLYYAGMVIHPEARPVAPIKENIGVEYISVSFRSAEDAVTLRGWLFGPRSSASAMILVHGFGENRFQFGADTIDVVKAMMDIGYDVLAFDLRNSGDSTPGVFTFGVHEKYDVLGAIAYARGLGYKNIVLHGVSTGANAAALAASETSMGEVGAVILDSPVVDIREYVLYSVRKRFPKAPDFPFRYTTPVMVGLYVNGDIERAGIGEGLAGFAPRPVLLIHGDNDDIVPKAEIMSVYNSYMERAVGQISLWNVRGAEHSAAFYVDREAYIDRIRTFIQRFLPQP